MKTTNFFLLGVLVAIMVACEDKSTTIQNNLYDWKLENQTYLDNVKNDKSYTAFTQAGQSYTLYYKINNQGDLSSVCPDSNDTVKVLYRGKIINGTVFDSNFSGTLPKETTVTSSFCVSGLIRGWQYSLMNMKIGEVRTIVMPYQLGYGTAGSGTSIPPYSTLIFEVQLKKVVRMK